MYELRLNKDYREAQILSEAQSEIHIVNHVFTWKLIIGKALANNSKAYVVFIDME